MSDPKYNKYAGTVRFDDDNIVDIELQPDTENITVKLNGSEVTGGSGLPEIYILEYAISGQPDQYGVYTLTSDTTFEDLLEIYESKVVVLKGDMFGGLQPASLTPLYDGTTITGFLMSSVITVTEASIDFCAVQFNDSGDTKTLTISTVSISS